ncbi:bromoperoxidase [Mycobacterium sp. NS-7484]|uniref:alpha/beta fold hydrolase n=1 Tax=unclassified Mycobacterium TaxID=2642494 RepID=UPI0007FF186D|nr:MULTISPECIES: alpha/beta hydrolase [unclassified Mycobacterium]OBG87503.1 bromoperoxidase [Mycobacterium sp. E802]OMB95113.1 bromoperoxidase [Mycobacterium sp. NS-7484]
MTAVTAYRGLLRSIDLHVEDTGGPGRPVVLIHGWPLTGESWSPQVQALQSAGYRVITYDRRGFGRSDTSLVGYTYESLSDDLSALMEELDLRDTTLVGFSMGGGEVASYCARKGTARVRSVVFASSVTPYMLHTKDNPEGPLSKTQAAQMALSLTKNQDEFYDEMMTDVFSAGGQLAVSEEQRQQAVAMCRQASKNAALACLTAFGNTDFREDLPRVTVPGLVIHGDADTTVPFAGSGMRTHGALRDSRLHVIEGGPHGIPMSHTDEFNRVLLEFLAEDFAATR